MNRRTFLQIAAPLLTAGWAASGAGAQPGVAPKARACILLFQVGGPFQCETFYPKPHAPAEIRGWFKPARTPVTSLYFAEGMPLTAAIDLAAPYIHRDSKYHLRGPSGGKLESRELVELLGSWASAYPIVCIEDAWLRTIGKVGRNGPNWSAHRFNSIADDLFATNPARLNRGIESGIANAVPVKLNQIGTLTETLDVFRVARERRYRAVIST